jgi:3',5'-cyclic AMP phosphodiesterase CpdA
MALQTIDTISQRERGQTVIAHVSDLHFDGDTKIDEGVWKALQADFRRHAGKIDLIAVTGDVINGSVGDSLSIEDTLARARDFLLMLCAAAGVSKECLFVVPGNHDVRISGILRKRSQAEAFRQTFRSYFAHAYFPQLRTCIFSFDSNASLSKLELAAGAVATAELTDLTAIVDQAETLSRWGQSTRVALIHHHPMPIAQRRDANNLEEYLLLRNAGEFMVQMLRCNVDLILHGHKHHPAASKAVYPERVDGKGGGARSIAVVAGGSAGKDEDDGAMYNLVTIRDSGEITIDRRSYSAAAFATTTPSTTLISYEEARAPRFERLARATNYELRLDEFMRLDEIVDTGGDLVSRVTATNVRSRTGKPVERYQQRFRASTSYFLDPKFSPNRVRWVADDTNPEEGFRNGFAVFDPPLGTDPLTFTRETRFANAIYFSTRDRSDATGELKATEDIGVNVRFVADRLTMAVTFPPYCYPPMPPRVVVECGGDGELQRDYAEEAYCAPFLISVESSRTFVFSVDRPLPGYRYLIEWPLAGEDPTEPPEVKPGVIGTLREIRRQLAEPARVPAVAAALSELREEFRAAPVLRAFGAEDETVDFSLFVYDDARKGLVCAHTTIAAPDDPIRTDVIAPGREIVGQSYRRRKPVLYLSELQTDTSAYTDTTKTGVFAVPLFYPILKGRRAGIVSLASSSNVTWLAQLQDNEALVQSVAEQLTRWWELLLRKRLTLPAVLKR